MSELEDDGLTFDVADVTDLDPVVDAPADSSPLDKFLNWDQVHADTRSGREEWLKLMREASEEEQNVVRARLDDRLATDFLDHAIPPRDRFADLVTLEPSAKSKMPVEFQARILKAMRGQALCMWPAENLPVHGWAFFGPAGWSKSTLCTAWFSRFAHANAMEIDYVRSSGLDTFIEFPKNRDKYRDASFLWRMNALTLIDENLAWQHRDFANKSAKQPRVSSTWIAALQSHYVYSCLYLEEVDKVRTDKAKLDILFDTIDALYNYHGVLLLNSNLTKQEFATQFGPEFARRISEMCNVVDCFAGEMKLQSV